MTSTSEFRFACVQVCIDQNNIVDGLKVLPIIVMSCRHMLIMCGPTYAARLWCIFEIWTLFSFVKVSPPRKHMTPPHNCGNEHKLIALRRTRPSKRSSSSR